MYLLQVVSFSFYLFACFIFICLPIYSLTFFLGVGLSFAQFHRSLKRVGHAGLSCAKGLACACSGAVGAKFNVRLCQRGAHSVVNR